MNRKPRNLPKAENVEKGRARCLAAAASRVGQCGLARADASLDEDAVRELGPAELRELPRGSVRGVAQGPLRRARVVALLL